MIKRVIGKLETNKKQVTILGAGFSGLILAYYLKKNGYNVILLEKSNRCGGKIQTKKSGPGLVEKGANALYLNHDALELLSELHLSPLPASKKLKRLIMTNGYPRRAFRLALIVKVLINGFKRPPTITEGLTVADFFRPLIGDEMVKNIISPALGGLYATNSENLHFKSIFFQISQRARLNSYWEFFKIMMTSRPTKVAGNISGSVSFAGGMQVLIDALSENLKNNIKINFKEQLNLKENTIICTDATSASELLKKLRPDLSEELKRIQYQEITSATVFMKKEIRSLNKSFGVVIPKEESTNSIGVLNNHSIFPKNYENNRAYTLISPKDLKDSELLSDLQKLQPDISIDDVEHTSFNHWEIGLPLYNLQRHLAIKRLHQILGREKGLCLFGNYVAGISLREMISAAKSFAERPDHYEGDERT